MRLHKLLQDEHITISGSEKVTPDAHTSDKEIHSLFDLKTILEEVKRRLPEEKIRLFLMLTLKLRTITKNCWKKFMSRAKKQNAACRKQTCALL